MTQLSTMVARDGKSGSQQGRIAANVATLEGSAILRIAGEIRQRIASGDRVCNLTVGDFPGEWSIRKVRAAGSVAEPTS